MTAGRAPVTSIRWTANIEVSRAAKYAPTIAATAAKATSSVRPDGSGNATAGRLGRASTAAREAGLRDAGTKPSSARRPEALQALAGGRQLETADEADLVHELDPELLERAAAGLGHQRESIGRPRIPGVLDEVAVARRDLCSADAVALEADCLEHAAGGELVLRVLEHAPEGPLVRRLGSLASCLEVGDGGLDLVGCLRLQAKLRPGYDLAGLELGTPVLEPQLAGRAPAGTVGRHDEGSLEDRAPVAAVGARVHSHAPADRARDRARELESAEPGGARAVQADRVRRTASGDQEPVRCLG